MDFATLFEAVAQHKPQSLAVVYGSIKMTYRELENRASKLAHFLSISGLGPHCAVGIMLRNSNTYLESAFAAFKLRGTPVNINYRYKHHEIAYVLNDARAEALVIHRSYADVVDSLYEAVQTLKCVLVVDDGSAIQYQEHLDYESTISDLEPMEPSERAHDDLYLIYTGGTTGYPKGVAYKNGDYLHQITAIMSRYGLESPIRKEDVPGFLDGIEEANAVPVVIPASPMMHQTGMSFGGLMPLCTGGVSVLLPGISFSPGELLRTAADNQVTSIAIVGDAFAVPIVEELKRAARAGNPWNLPFLKTIVSSGAAWSYDVRKELLDHLDVVLADNIAATEGNMGLAVSTRGNVQDTGVFTPMPNVTVLDDNMNSIAPGSNAIGRLAVRSSLPLGYHRDKQKSDETFVTIGDARYTLPGDHAQLLENGDIRLLGRGNNCINTGGEKVYPEEVEETLKRHKRVVDALVVGIPDERFGQRVAAVVAAEDVDPEKLIAFAKEHLAGFKVPRHITITPTISRFASGKPDYSWARSILNPPSEEQD